VIDPKGVNVQEQIEEVVQRNLREVLGAQFTEKEGARLISRAYNPQLGPAYNVPRLRRLFSQMEQAAKAKEAMADYFEKNETLMGYKGPTIQIEDFYTALGNPQEAPEPAAPAAPAAPSSDDLPPEFLARMEKLPKSVRAQRMEQAAELWKEMSPEEREQAIVELRKR